MKRKKIQLNYTFILIFAALLVTLFFNFLEQRNFYRTIETDYKVSLTYSANDIVNTIGENSEKSLTSIGTRPDISVILMTDKGPIEMNSALSSERLSTLLQSSFLSSPEGKRLLKEKLAEPVYFSYQNEENETFSFFLLTRNTRLGQVVISKNVRAFELYLHNKELVDFGRVIALSAIIFFLLIFLNKRILNRIDEMTECAYDFSNNKFDKSIRVVSNNQIDQLAIAINKLGKSLEAGNLMNTQERNLLMHIYNSLDMGIIWVEEDFSVSDLNATGQKLYNTFVKDDASPTGIAAYFQMLITETRRTNIEQQVEFQHNQLIYAIQLRPVEIDEELATCGVLMIIKDITNDKQLVSMREDLITNVSHDLRTPLATIQGYSEAIMDNIADSKEEKNEMARIIHDEATQMSRMITSLLTLSRINAGYTELNKAPVDLTEFFQKILLRFSERLHHENIACDLEIEQGIPEYVMDEEKMHQAVYNLIDNAIHYAAPKESRSQRYIHIEVRLDELVDDLLIIVSDNGIGISEQSLPYIFERFYKDDKARTMPKNNGSGIGLSLVQSVVTAHGGKVAVESVPDLGTTFLVRLPLDGGMK